MGKSRILLIERKHIAIIGILLFVVIFIILGCVISFSGSDNNTVQTFGTTNSLYHAGVYSTEFKLDNQLITMEITLDENHINDITLPNITDEIRANYPLLESTLDSIKTQLINGSSLSDVVISSDSTYTGKLLINSINSILESAKR